MRTFTTSLRLVPARLALCGLSKGIPEGALDNLRRWLAIEDSLLKLEVTSAGGSGALAAPGNLFSYLRIAYSGGGYVPATRYTNLVIC